MKNKVGKVTFTVVQDDDYNFTVRTKAQGKWSLGSLLALRSYIDELIKDIKKKAKDEDRRK